MHIRTEAINDCKEEKHINGKISQLYHISVSLVKSSEMTTESFDRVGEKARNFSATVKCHFIKNSLNINDYLLLLIWQTNIIYLEIYLIFSFKIVEMMEFGTSFIAKLINCSPSI